MSVGSKQKWPIVALCARAHDRQVAKFKIHQFFLETDLPNLMLAKFSHSTVSDGGSYDDQPSICLVNILRFRYF